jgi:hypothetical protein
MKRRLIEYCLGLLEKRRLNDGGFTHKLGGGYRPDATAWAILAFQSVKASGHKHVIDAAQTRLMTDQLEDGRVSISPNHPDAFWPTALALLAWHDSEEHDKPRSKALRFLLDTTGLHWSQKADGSGSHDPSIKGWPWIANTHSWVEPTALAMIALRTEGLVDHQRFGDATRMLLDRQLPQGGWNYGNTIVFGKTLRPTLLSTGMALDALAKNVDQREVKSSLAYLKKALPHIRSPQTLGWGVLGIQSWEERPSETLSWIEECLGRQDIYGAYDTCSLSLILVSLTGASSLTVRQ